jgi:hypothetical protein
MAYVKQIIRGKDGLIQDAFLKTGSNFSGRPIARRGFSGRSAAAQANALRRAGNLSKLGQAALYAGTVGQVLNFGNLAFDAIRCWK